MGQFTFLRSYILTEGDHISNKKKHSFNRLNDNDINNAELRMNIKLPEELIQFFKEIGYGFMSNKTKQGINRLMDPSSIVDFRLGESVYENDPDRVIYDNDKLLVFFEVSEGTYLTMDFTNVSRNDEEQCPIYYFDEKIADSLYEFLVRMDSGTDYFI